MKPTFSIIVVCFNAGEKLYNTVASINAQTFRNFEIIVKDGDSTDGSISELAQKYGDILNAPTIPYMTLIKGKDKGIYDAMNIALNEVNGDYVIFMNCGDFFFDENVLKRTAKVIAEDEENNGKSMIYYGDINSQKSNTIIPAPRSISGFTCYRNIPCHQACFYSKELFDNKKYDLQYKIRADYEHFLWCFYKGNAEFKYLGFTVASYEGGGYSETEANIERDRNEHDVITREYMSKSELVRYKTTLGLTLAPLRRAIANNPKLANTYQSIKHKIYK